MQRHSWQQDSTLAFLSENAHKLHQSSWIKSLNCTKKTMLWKWVGEKNKNFALFFEKLMSSFTAASIVLTWQLMWSTGASMGTFDLQRCLDRWFVSICVWEPRCSQSLQSTVWREKERNSFKLSTLRIEQTFFRKIITLEILNDMNWCGGILCWAAF